MPLPATVKNKKQGDIIRSDDWNIVTNEVDRLDTAKANLSGAAFTGPLSVQAPTGQPQLSLAGSSGNVNTAQGDLSIGNTNSFQLRIGVDINSGDARIRALQTGGTAKLNNRLILGGGSADVLTISPGLVASNVRTEITATGGLPTLDLIANAGDMTPRLQFRNTKNDTQWVIGAYEPNETGLHFWCSKFGDVLQMKPNGNLQFANVLGQRINLWSQEYGIGIQNSSMYHRTGAHFQWFRGGSHHPDTSNPGTGGTQMMILDSAAVLWVNGAWLRVKGAGNEQCYIGGDGAGGDVQVGSMNAAISNIVMYNAATNTQMNLYAAQGIKPGGGPWANSSDERLKKNIQTLSGSLDKLLRLRGVSYEYNDPSRRDYLPGTQHGMVAQEVEKVFPEWISEGKDGFKTLGIMGFEALVVEALRELKNEIEAIKEKIGLTTAPQAAARSTKKS